MLDLNSETTNQSNPKAIFVIFRNNLNEFWDVYHGINMSVGSPKAGNVFRQLLF
jgi:isocitrate dehydrogenase